MRRLFTILLALTLSPSLFADAENKRKIELLKKYVKQKHAQEHRSVVEWLKNPGSEDRPDIPPKLLRSYKHLSRLFKKEGEATKAKWFDKVLTHYEQPTAPKRQEDPTASQDDPWYVKAGYLRYNEKIAVSISGEKLAVQENFSGLFAAFGKKFLHDYALEGRVFIANANLKKGDYAQESAVVKGFGFTPYYHSPGETYNFTIGLPVLFRSLETTKKEGVEAKLESPMIFGPEVGFHFRATANFQLNADVAYLQGAPAYSASATYEF